MFVAAPELKRVAAPAERIAAVIQSINTPNVVIPGGEAEPTQAYIVGVRNPDASFSVLIYLYQTASNLPAIYVCEPRTVALAEYPEVEAEALLFVESMGFMVDNLNFRRMTHQQQAELMERLPAFHEDLSAFGPGKDSPADVDGLDGLEDLDDADALPVIEHLGETDGQLPVIQAMAEGDSPDAISALDAAFDNLVDSGEVTGPRLDDQQRAIVARLLAVF